MINWTNLAANAVWILGCAVILATLSYASWEASTLRERIGARLGRPSYQVAINLGVFLFTMGLAATADGWFARIVWIILALLSLFFVIQAARQAKREPKIPQVPPENQ